MNITFLACHSVLSLVFSFSAVAQSSFALRNLVPFAGIDAPVFDATGTPLEGTNYLVELWGAASQDLLQPLHVISEGDRREIIPFLSRGYFLSSSAYLVVDTVPTREWAWLQVRAWDARLGGTYEEVVARGLGGYGESLLFYARGGDPLVIPPTSPGPLIGLQSFSLRAVIPEPSTWVLLAGGGLALWWASRRRRSR